MSKSLTLSHNFQPEFSETLNDITEITVALEDGKIAVNKMYFLLAGRFWLDLFKSIDSPIIDRIIIPDFSISYFEKFIELLTNGETKYTSSDVTYQFLSHFIWITCQLDSKHFKSSKDNDMYYTSFNVTEPTACKFCLKIFKSKQSTESHEKICKNNEHKWNCEQCSKVFKTKIGLESHISSKHYTEMKFVCNTCQSTYTSLYTLRRHCQDTLHEYPNLEGPLQKDEIKCDVCYKILKCKKYESHKKKHSNGNEFENYKCFRCDYETMRKDNLKRHIELKHNVFDMDFDALKDENGHQTYKCPECNQKFDSIQKIEDHLVLKNCKEIICSFCKKTFTMKHHLTRHIKKFHADAENL